MVRKEPQSLRTFLGEMESRGELHRIRKEVDPHSQLPALSSESDKPILFENIKGYSGWRVADCLLRFRRHQAVALDCSEENLIPDLAIKYMMGAGKTRLVDDGPVKELIWKEDEVDLSRLPASTPSEGIDVPHLGLKARDFHIPTISGGFAITKDPVTKVQNTLFPSSPIVGPRKLQFYVFSTHTRENIKRHRLMDRRAPMALVLGCHPAYEVAAVYTGPHPDYGELEIAGRILGETIEMVPAETVDLEVPAHAEMVIEGYIDPEVGEYINVASHTDTYAPIKSRQPFLDVTCITMRKNPIYRHIQPTRWTDHHALCEFIIAPMLYGILKGKGLKVRDVAIPLHSAINCAVIQMTPRSEEDVREALLTSMTLPYMPRLTVAVDEDVNIQDPNDILYALSIRVDPARDVLTLDGLRTFEEDPLGKRIRGREKEITTSIGRLGIDATKPPPCRPAERILFERLQARGEKKVKLKDFVEQGDAKMTPAPATHLAQDPKKLLEREQKGEIEKICDDIYEVYSLANAGVVVTQEGVVVIDTTTSPATARQLLERIRTVTDQPIRYVINTHYHGDHTYGNPVFKAEGAELIGSKLTAELMVKREKRVKAFYLSRGLPMAQMQVLPPETTFESEYEFKLGGKTFQLKHFGPSETDDAIAVYVPENKVLFAGDTVMPYGFPIFGMPLMNEGLRDDGWIRTLEKLEQLDVDHVVSGHGSVSNRSVIGWMKEICEFMLSEVTAQVDEAKTLDETLEHVFRVMPESMKNLPRVWGTPELGVMRVYSSLTGFMELSRSAIEPASEKEVENVVRRVGEYPEALLHEADEAVKEEEFELAYALAQLACKLDPENGKAHAVRGDILMDWANTLISVYDKGELLSKAGEATQTAMKLDPECGIAYVNAGLYQIGTSPFTGADPREGIRLIETGLKKGIEGPRVVKAVFGIAMAHEFLGELEEARTQYQKALDMFPGLDPAREALNRIARDEALVKV